LHDITAPDCAEHRYLMTRLSLQVIYMWRHVSSTAPPFILWWLNLEILFGPLLRSSTFTGVLRCQAILKWNTVLYSRKNPKSSLYCEMSIVYPPMHTAADYIFSSSLHSATVYM
jgi:hypothetical protein